MRALGLMTRETVFSLAEVVVDMGYDVTISGSAARNEHIARTSFEEHWSLIIDSRDTVDGEQMLLLIATLADRGFDVRFSPVGRGLWVQPKG